MGNDNFTKFSDNKISNEIENLIEEDEENLINNENKKLSELKKSTKELSEFSNDESLKLSELVKNKEAEIQNLRNEEILLERSQIQFDIQDKQKLIIEEYKANINKLKLDLEQLNVKAEELNISNRKLLINNNELKNTLSRYIKHNKNLQFSINEVKKIKSEYLDNKSQVVEMTKQIKFYQDDNSRLSNEIIILQKKYEMIKNNFDTAEKAKNDIFKQIQDLNNSLTSNNIVGTPYVKEILVDDSINSKVLNDISKKNIEEKKKSLNVTDDLDKEINDIFK